MLARVAALSSCETRARSCARARPRRSAASTRGGIGSPIVSPIAFGDVEADEVEQRERPHRVPGAELACTCRRRPASMPVSSISRTALNRYGNSRRLTTKPGMSGTSTGVFSNASHSASARARVSALAAAGKIELDELHLRDGVEHVQAEEALGPPARLRQPLDRQRGGGAGEDRLGVEDARPARRAAPALTSWSSTTASTTNVAGASASRSVTICTCAGSTSAPRRRASSRRSPARARPSSPSARAAAPARGGRPWRPGRRRSRRCRRSRDARSNGRSRRAFGKLTDQSIYVVSSTR